MHARRQEDNKMKLRKCMAMLLAALLLLGAMPVWAAEADTAVADTAEPRRLHLR